MHFGLTELLGLSAGRQKVRGHRIDSAEMYKWAHEIEPIEALNTICADVRCGGSPV